VTSPLRGIPLYIYILLTCIVLVLGFSLWLHTINGLCWSLHHGVDSARSRAAHELSNTTDSRAIRCLLAALSDEDPSTRNNAVVALAWRADIGLLVEASNPADPVARAQVFPLLSSLADRDPGRLVPLFTAALSDPQPAVRRYAVEGLGRLGGLAESSLPSLLPLVADPDPRVRDATVRSLDHIGGAAALREAMKNQSPEAQLALIQFLYYQYYQKGPLIEELLPEINQASGYYLEPEVSRLAMQIILRVHAAQNAAPSPTR